MGLEPLKQTNFSCNLFWSPLSSPFGPETDYKYRICGLTAQLPLESSDEFHAYCLLCEVEKDLDHEMQSES